MKVVWFLKKEQTIALLSVKPKKQAESIRKKFSGFYYEAVILDFTLKEFSEETMKGYNNYYKSG